MNKTHVMLVVDRSGSMHGIWHEALRMLGRVVDEVRAGATAPGQETTLSLVSFSNVVKLHWLAAPLDSVVSLPLQRPDGSTALFDAVGDAVDHLSGLPDARSLSTSFLVIVITDGEENNSRRHERVRLLQRLRDVQATDRWSLVFQVPRGYAGTVRDLGIPSDNIREWSQDAAGVRQVAEDLTAGMRQYFHARSRGGTSTASFYVKTDLMRLDETEVREVLPDISLRFRTYVVDRESPVKEFVEGKTGRPYRIGSAYYQLTKPERVGGRKVILLQKKGATAIYGGAEARRLVGLPEGVEASVDPGAHGVWDIFVASTSVNRKLVRGTRVLVDMTHTHDLEPTWQASP